MRVGIFYFNPDYGIDISELARELEERGFASLYVPEHTHIPTSRRTPLPHGGDIHRTQSYAHIHDPFVALSFAAAATEKLLGRHRRLPDSGARPDRHCQVRCQPRPIVGLDGSFWGSAAAGTLRRWKITDARYETRFKVMRERVLAMKALWTQEDGLVPRRIRQFRPRMVVAKTDTAPPTRQSFWAARAIIL